MTRLADPTKRDFVSGLECELAWSEDESVIELYIVVPNIGRPGISNALLKMTPAQLDDLRAFIMDNID